MPHAVLVPLVDRSRLTIGRAADNHVIIDASHVSSHHARVVMHEGRHVIEDAGSRNGTWLGGRRIQRHTLMPGDVVKVGSATLTYDGHSLQIEGAPTRVRQMARGSQRSSSGTSAGQLYMGCVAIFAASLFLGLIGFAAVYAAVASELPDPATLEQRLSQFRSAWILDRNGQVLSEAFDQDSGRRTIVTLDHIAPELVQATVATEDAYFYEHGGVDPVALARAMWYAASSGRVVSGASTIPQQLVKLAFLSPERTVQRKVREAILAHEVSRKYSKTQVLTYYLNEVYYGNMAYGIQSAAQTYFGKDAVDLNLAESALLAGLPQAPAYYDPYSYPERAKRRREIVLGLMVKSGYLDAATATATAQSPMSFASRASSQVAPHFVIWVREQVEQRVGPEAVYRTGLKITTSLDAELQMQAETIVRDHVDALVGKDATNGALVALRPDTGEILALVGSKDFRDDAIAGQVNMAVVPRQPGSAIKPFVYMSAFAQTHETTDEPWTPGTLLPDFVTEFTDGVHAPYTPANYDGREHGLVTVRQALGSSYNIPAVRALEVATVPEFLALARRVGLTSLDRDDYGLPIALGAAEVPLVDLTAAYGVLARNGRRVLPVAVRKITDDQDRVLCEIGTTTPCHAVIGRADEQVLSAADAFLITDILSDNAARAPAFGPRSPLVLDRPAAAKTGTTNDYRDNWTIGYTPQLVAGVWVGNADNRPMQGMTGISGAAPIWNAFMTRALANTAVEDFSPPAGVRRFTVCADTGSAPSPACPERRMAWFADDRPPLPAERDLWQMVRIDSGNGLLADASTPPDRVEERAFKVYPAEHRAWAEANGLPQPPVDVSPPEPPTVIIAWPSDGDSVTGRVAILGSAGGSRFVRYTLEIGTGDDPDDWTTISPTPVDSPVADDVLGIWDATNMPAGPYTLRLTVEDDAGNLTWDDVVVNVEAAGNGSATPTATPTDTATPDGALPTPTPTATATVTPTPEPPALLRWLLEP